MAAGVTEAARHEGRVEHQQLPCAFIRGGINWSNSAGVCAHAIESRITAQHISGAIHPVVRDPNLRWTAPASPLPILSGSIGHLMQRTSRPRLAGTSFLTCFGKIMLPMRTRVNGAWF